MSMNKFVLEKEYKKISNEDILNDVKRVLIYLNKETLFEREYHLYGKYGRKAIRNHFKSWTNVLNELNLPVKRNNSKLSKEEIFEIIEDLWTKKGSQPTIREFETTHHTKKIIISNFGTWMQCLKEFIEYKNRTQNTVNSIKVINHKTKREPSVSLRYDVLKRDNYKCVICGRSPANDPSIILHVDHIIPYSKGGETAMNNLQTLCQHCNLGKSDK